MRMVAVVLAGGSGQRFGAAVPKQLLELDGRTLLEHCVAAFDAAPGVDEVLVVMPPGRTADAGKLRADGAFPKLSAVIEGGTSRPGSTRAALAAIAARRGPAAEAGGDGSADDWAVLFHDAARPLVDQRIIADCVAALATVDAVGVAVPTADTIVVVADGVMTQIPRRDSLRRCQTPQGFRLPVITRAHELALADPDYEPTDDCGVVLRYLPDVPVHVVPGSERNMKITYPKDLAIARALLGRED
ncbi:MAG: 2-C-methyl-D-erythritol 4-phosphate cytidylyltransferase [Actinobacteria bacterium]|nr:2-C-methyl-D-erythritol 4-phosphate cytidylyltransferase [Actinomycetota bacterium]